MKGTSFTVTTIITLEDFDAEIDVVKEAIENAITQNVPTAFNEHGQNTCNLSQTFNAYEHEFTVDSIEVTTVRKQVLK